MDKKNQPQNDPAIEDKMKEQMTAHVPLEARSPRLCTFVTFHGNGESVIMTLGYDEKPTFPDAIVLNRFLINRELASKMIDVLKTIVETPSDERTKQP